MTVINTNVSALRAQNSSRIASMDQSQAMERLSTGKRINSAKDDAAGLAIATRMDAKVRGMNQAVRNANDGISLAQTAEGAMGEISNTLVRMRELTVQAANGTASETDRAAIQTEVKALATQINNIAEQTEFNGNKLLNGEAGAADTSATFNIQTGTESGEDLEISFSLMSATGLKVSTVDDGTITDDSIDVTTADNAKASLAKIDDAINTVAGQRSAAGAAQSGLETTINNLNSTSTNLSEAKSRIEDADFSVESTKLASAQILSQASTAMLAQANQSQQGVMQLLR